MDDNKSHVKSVVSMYINRRQLSYVKPRVISKRNLLKQTSLRARISRTAMNSFVNYCDDEQDEDDQLLVEYSFMFQKFMHWLREETDQKQRCYDIEKLVGPLFCHLYMDIQHNNKYHEESSNLFFKTHIDKIDRSKCDSKILDIITAIESSLDNMGVLNGTDTLGLENLRNVFRSTRIVVHLNPESLKLLKQFISWKSRTKSHMVLLQAVQSWFDLKEVPSSEDSDSYNCKKSDPAPSCTRTTSSSGNHCDASQNEDNLEDDDQLLVEYSFTYQKFLHWLKEQTDQRHRCYDLEKLVGPLFCRLYMDVKDQSEASSNLFFKTHIHKIDRSKCDIKAQEILKAIELTLDNTTVLSSKDVLAFKEMLKKFKRTKTVLHLKPESLKFLMEFMASHCSTVSGVKFVQCFLSWFDQGKCKFENANNFNENKLDIPKSLGIEENAMSIDKPVQFSCEICLRNVGLKKFESMVQQNSRVAKMETDEEEQKLTQQKNKIKSVIKKIRKLPAAVCNFRIVNTKHFVTCGIIRSNAGLVAFVERNILKVIPAQMLADHVRFIHHSKQIYCIALCPNNEILCTGSADRTICVYSLSKFKLVRRLFGHLGPVYSLAISHNSKYLASGSHDGTARLWSLRSGKLLRIFAGHSEAVMCADFHPNSLYLATGSADRNIRVWCLNNAKTVRLLHAAKKEIYSLVFSPNGQYLASSDDRRVRIWNLANSKIFHEYKNRESVFQLTWSKNGKQLCGGTASGVVKIWEVRDKDKDHTREHKHSHSDYVLRRYTNGRLLAIDYTLGTWICLSTPNQPFMGT